MTPFLVIVLLPLGYHLSLGYSTAGTGAISAAFFGQKKPEITDSIETNVLVD
jgi:hypothetical protein